MTDATALREEIRRIRGELGDTMEALAAKTSPTQLGSALATRAKAKARETASRRETQAGLMMVGAIGVSTVLLFRLLRRMPTKASMKGSLGRLTGRKNRRRRR